MTKRQAWLFAVVATLLCSGAFLALTIHSHTRFPELTNSENLTHEVERGMEVWHEYNCINCHTMYGEGAYYAPDLTNIASQRSDTYLKAFLKDPSKFYSPEDYGRVMPDLPLSDKEIDQLIAFFKWVDKVDTHNWPPRQIRVTGSGVAQGQTSGQPADSNVARGRALYGETGCESCHSTAEGVRKVGPSLAGIADRGEQIIEQSDYQGDADSAEAYIRESILEPDAHLVEGQNFASNGRSMMPNDYDERLSDDQLDALVEYLMSLD